MKTFTNPILSGFYPDPSICRVGEDYYIVNSTFSYHPGVPIFHSKDLVHWKQIGNILDRESQLPLTGAGHSEGIFAPTIRYHEGTFYMITTNISGLGNFYVTATNPAGPWSEPVVLEEGYGIDPSLFFDEDGKAYYIGTMEKDKSISKYWGDNIIYLRELDLKAGKLVGEQHILWEGAFKNVVWAEGPHLYKKDGYYYLMIAEGGTGHEHSITVARSKNITGPYESDPCNPILTHRHLGKSYPIANAGHGDLVETQNGDWWMVLLASRPFGGYYRNLGRESFLVPVTWEDGWPVINEGKGIVEEVGVAPNLPEFEVVPQDHCTHFDGEDLGLNWLSLRGPKEVFCSLKDRPGYLRLQVRPESIKERVIPSFIGIRQEHMSFNASTMVEFNPEQGEVAGLVLIQSDTYHFRYEYTKKAGKNYIQLIKCEDGKDELLGESELNSPCIYMKVVENGQELDFYYGAKSNEIKKLVGKVDARILSTDVAGGFVGACIGMYASSNGKDSKNHADFRWFEYSGI